MEIIPVISPRFILAAIFILLPLVYWGFNFVMLYHLLHFGIGVQPKRFAAIYFVGSSFLFCLGILLFINIDVLTFKNELVNAVKSISLYSIY